MKVLAVTIRVKKNKIEEAQNFFRTFVSPSRSEAGCIQYDLFQSSDDPQIFYFFEKWKDDKAFDVHCAQPFLADFQSRYVELLEEPNKLLWLNQLD